MDKILFISHESTRTGAPLILLEFIKWLSAKNKFKIYVLIVKSGILDSEFKKYGKVINTFEIADTRKKIIILKFIYRFKNSLVSQFLKEKIVYSYLKILKFQIVYSNTITNGQIINNYIPKNYRIITHVHELPTLINSYGKLNLSQVIKYSNFFIASSNLVKFNLVSRYSIDINSIDVVYPSIDLNQKLENNLFSFNNPKKYIIGSSGSLSFEKGADRLIPFILQLLKFRTDFHFIWIGVNLNSKFTADFQVELIKNKIDSYVSFLGNLKYPITLFEKLDLFVLFSREESFSIVTIENCFLKKPVLCYAGVGGTEEILSIVPQNIIPSDSHFDMATRVNQLLNDDFEYGKVVNMMKIKVDTNYSHDICFPKLLEIVERNIKNN